MSGTTFFLSGEDIRNILLNAQQILEHDMCPHCEGTGWQNWSDSVEHGKTDVKPGRIEEFDWGRRNEDECDLCEGVGYLDWL